MSRPYAKPADAAGRPARVTVPALAAMAREGTPIAMLTAYDASFAALCDRAGVDVVLVGDSLGMVIQGRESTLPVTLADVVYHTRCVAAGCTARARHRRPPVRQLSGGPRDCVRRVRRRRCRPVRRW